jgi:hypothetical protein
MIEWPEILTETPSLRIATARPAFAMRRAGFHIRGEMRD